MRRYFLRESQIQSLAQRVATLEMIGAFGAEVTKIQWPENERGRLPSTMPGSLAGLRILELADEKGQFCGKLLGDLGADVLKIEPDQQRAVP
jgi:hypothetical protein